MPVEVGAAACFRRPDGLNPPKPVGIVGEA